MKRSEFMNGPAHEYGLGDLVNFCWENGCDDIVSDVYDEEQYYREIDEAVEEYIHNYSWTRLREALNDLPEGYSYYRRNGTLDWDGLENEDVDDYIDDVVAWMDDNDGWDPEDDDEEDDEPEEEPEEEPEPSIEDGDFLDMCAHSTEIATRLAEQHDEAEPEEEQDVPLPFPELPF